MNLQCYDTRLTITKMQRKNIKNYANGHNNCCTLLTNCRAVNVYRVLRGFGFETLQFLIPKDEKPGHCFLKYVKLTIICAKGPRLSEKIFCTCNAIAHGRVKRLRFDIVVRRGVVGGRRSVATWLASEFEVISESKNMCVPCRWSTSSGLLITT